MDFFDLVSKYIFLKKSVSQFLKGKSRDTRMIFGKRLKASKKYPNQ